MRVPRTFVFIDLSGFTDYTAVHGDDAAGHILGAFRSIVRDAASARGVRIAKWLGDGCMVVAVEQVDAIAFVLDIQQRATEACAPLTIRAGIATGRALLFEGDDYIGSAVNMASRLCDAATGVQVLMPAAHVEELPPNATAVDHGSLTLNGFPDTVDVVDIEGSPEPVTSDSTELWTRTLYA